MVGAVRAPALGSSAPELWCSGMQPLTCALCHGTFSCLCACAVYAYGVCPRRSLRPCGDHQLFVWLAFRACFFRKPLFMLRLIQPEPHCITRLWCVLCGSPCTTLRHKLCFRHKPCAMRVQRALRRAWSACGCRPGGQGHGTLVPALTPALASPPRLCPPSDRISSQMRQQRQPPPSCTWPSCLRCRPHKPLAQRLRILLCRCVLLPLCVVASHGTQALLSFAHQQVPAYTCVSCRRCGLLEAPPQRPRASLRRCILRPLRPGARRGAQAQLGLCARKVQCVLACRAVGAVCANIQRGSHALCSAALRSSSTSSL